MTLETPNISILATNAVKVFRLSRRNNPVESLVLFYRRMRMIERTVPTRVVRWQQHIQDGRSVRSGAKLVKIAFDRVQYGDHGCLQIVLVAVPGALGALGVVWGDGRAMLGRVWWCIRNGSLLIHHHQIERETLQVSIQHPTQHTHAWMIVEWNLGVWRKHKNAHTVFVGYFRQVNVTHHGGRGAIPVRRTRVDWR